MTSEIDDLIGLSKTSAQRSAMDDVIDAVGDTPQRKKIRVCPECEGTAFTKRKPFGAGTISYKCQSCGFLLQGPSQTSAKIVVEKAKVNPQAKGPYYSGTELKPPVDTHAPKYRTKSITRPKE